MYMMDLIKIMYPLISNKIEAKNVYI